MTWKAVLLLAVTPVFGSFMRLVQEQADDDTCALLSHAIALPNVWNSVSDEHQVVWRQLCGRSNPWLPRASIGEDGSVFAVAAGPAASLLQQDASPRASIRGHIIKLAPEPGAYKPDGKGSPADQILDQAGGARAVLDRMQQASPLRGAEYPFVAGTDVVDPGKEARKEDPGGGLPPGFAEASRAMARLQSRNAAVRLRAAAQARDMAQQDAARLHARADARARTDLAHRERDRPLSAESRRDGAEDRARAVMRAREQATEDRGNNGTSRHAGTGAD